MSAIRWIVTIVMIIVSLALTALVLMQEGKSHGLGAIAGAAETYWGRNKGRTMEGRLVKITAVLVAVFFLLAILLNMNIF